MAEILLPPRITAYYKMVKGHWVKHAGPGLFAFWYQQEDRYRHEEIPDVKRLQLRLYDQAVIEYKASGWWTPVQSEGSTLDPDTPWNHIMLLAVRSSDARHWWTEQFKDDATKVILRIKNVSTLIEGDAPIAASLAEHISRPYMPSQPKGRPEAPWKQPKAPKQPPAEKRVVEQQVATKKRNVDVTGKHKICHDFTKGKCTEVKNGQCGPNTCAAKSVFIHACCFCGEVGHNGKSCPTRQAGPDNKRQRGVASGKGKGRGGRG
jgi:hypothetical protein